MAGLHFTVVAAGSSLVIYLRGELDRASTEQLFLVLTAVLDDSDARALELDLADLTFVDMAGLRALQTVHSDARQRGCDLNLRSMSPHVQRIVSLCGMGDICPDASRTLNPAVLAEK